MNRNPTFFRTTKGSFCGGAFALLGWLAALVLSASCRDAVRSPHVPGLEDLGGMAGTAAGGAAGLGGAGGGDEPSSPVGRHGQLRVEGTRLVDQAGQPVQLKGVSSMWLNWESYPFAESKPALREMRDRWKISVIRAAMGIDKSGGYLESAAAQKLILKQLETVVQNAIALGVYVIIDWHTELAAEQQEAAVAFFTDMAERYGKYPNVIYEPYNEPNRHTPVPPAVRGVPFTWAEIKAYHQAVVAAIRAKDPDNLIVLGTPQWSQRVDQAADDPVPGANLLYTLHFYACTHRESFRALGDMALAKGLPLFVTEFGATPADGGVPSNNLVCEDETNRWLAWMATNGVSGAAWKLNRCDDSSCLLGEKAPFEGPWPDEVLTSHAASVPVDGGVVKGGGHGQLIVNWLRQ